MFSTTKKLFFIAILCSPTLVAAEPPEHLVSVLAFEAVPESYRISIDSNGNGKIQLVVLGSDIDFSKGKGRYTFANSETQDVSIDTTGEGFLKNIRPGWGAFSFTDPEMNAVGVVPVVAAIGDAKEPFKLPPFRNGRKIIIDNLRRDITNPRSETLVYASFDSYQQTPVPFYRVRLREDGRLTGFTVVPKVVDQELAISNSMNVSIIRDGEPVARTISNEDGSFEFTNLEPSIYGVIAGGPPGFSAFSFELLEAGAPEFTPVSTRAKVNRMAAAVAADLVVLVTPKAMLAKALEPIEKAIAESVPENISAPGSPLTNFGPGVSPAGSPAGVQGSGFGGGGFGGGGVPGGAGFGGASGFGTIGALGAVGAAAAVTSANSNAVIPPVASPAAL